MKTRSFIGTVAALSLASVALAAGTFIGGAAADSTTIPLGKAYSSGELAAICSRDGGQSYRAARGTYGCILGSNVVECWNDGSCRGSTTTPLAVAGGDAANHRGIGAEQVLQAQPAPGLKITSSDKSGLSLAPQ